MEDLLFIILSLLVAFLGALLLWFWRIVRSQRILLALFDEIARDPDLIPTVPIEGFPKGTEARRVLEGFAGMIERIQASKQRLRESEERFELAMRGTNDGLWAWDLLTDEVYFSPRWKEMLGFADHEIPDRLEAWVERVHPDDRERVLATLKSYLAGRSPAYELEHRLLHKDGTYRWICARGAAARDATGRAIRLAGSHEDITERKRIEEELKETSRMLEQRVEERTRELSALLEVSHNVASMLELKPLLGLILSQLKTVVDYHGAAVLAAERGGLRILDYRGPIPAEQAMRVALPPEQVQDDWNLLRRGEPIIVADMWDDSPPARGLRRSLGPHLETTFGYIRSWMGVPLMLKDQAVGMLSLEYSEPDYYTAEHAKLALAFANQAAVAIENARLYEQAQALAALEERQRLARELHDSVSQALYGIALGARTARTLLDRDPSRLAEPLDYVLSLAEAGLAEMRALIFELRPESLANEGLVAALTKQAASLRARHQLEVHTALGEEPDLPIEVKEVLYRVAQEALHNISKHARARRVEVRLEHSLDAVNLEIGDDGVGFDPAGPFPGHLGLRSMRERTARLGGTLTVDSAPGQGTRLRAQIPHQDAS